MFKGLPGVEWDTIIIHFQLKKRRMLCVMNTRFVFSQVVATIVYEFRPPLSH